MNKGDRLDIFILILICITVLLTAITAAVKLHAHQGLVIIAETILASFMIRVLQVVRKEINDRRKEEYPCYKVVKEKKGNAYDKKRIGLKEILQLSSPNTKKWGKKISMFWEKHEEEYEEYRYKLFRILNRRII